MTLTARQVEVLCTLLPRPLTPKNVALQVSGSTSAATRVCNTLCNKRLAYPDVPPFGEDGRVWFVVTSAGEAWVRDNRTRVEAVHRDLGFTPEEVASLWPGVHNDASRA